MFLSFLDAGSTPAVSTKNSFKIYIFESNPAGSYLSQNLTFSQLLLGRVAVSTKNSFEVYIFESNPAGSYLLQNLTFSQFLLGRVFSMTTNFHISTNTLMHYLSVYFNSLIYSDISFMAGNASVSSFFFPMNSTFFAISYKVFIRRFPDAPFIECAISAT